MRAIFVNACHPDTTHVCGQRARAFANAMAARGHQIVLLTPPLEESANGDDRAMLKVKIEAHDWSLPCRIVAPYRQGSTLPNLRQGKTPNGLRQFLIAGQYLRHGSVFEDWCAGVIPFLPTLCDTFSPDIVWAVFGHTGCFRVAQRVAARASCPWIMDVKDTWTSFIPAIFRKFLGHRFSDAAHITALSAAHASLIHHWIPNSNQTVVYSGIPSSFISDAAIPAQPVVELNSIFLCGSIYDTTHLEMFFSALSQWRDNHYANSRPTFRLCYAGADSDKFKFATRTMPKDYSVEILGHLALNQLHARMSTATINLHLYFPPVLFHHKLFELIAANRPILCFPGESDEAQNIADYIGARLYRCSTHEHLLTAFNATLGSDRNYTSSVSTEKLSRYSWDEQSIILENVFRTVTQKE